MYCEAITEFGKPLQRIEGPTPTPTGSEVLVRVEHCGVCHSDVHIHDGYFDMGGAAKMPLGLPLPHTLGHEVAGEVIAVGPRRRPGPDRPAPRALLLDRLRQVRGLPARRGELLQRPAQPRLFGRRRRRLRQPRDDPRSEVPDRLRQDPAGAGGDLHVLGPHRLRRAEEGPALGPKDDVLIVGAGGLGMMAIQFAKEMFGKGPLVADIDAGRLQAAMGAGAKAAYNTTDPEALKQLMADTEGGALASIDFVGSESSFGFANQSVRRGGRVIIVGLFGGGMSMPIPMFPFRAITIGGSYVGSLAEAEAMMELVRAGKVDPIPVKEVPLVVRQPGAGGPQGRQGDRPGGAGSLTQRSSPLRPPRPPAI